MIKYLPRREAEALAAKPKTAKLTQRDAWNKLHTWTVEWQPQMVDNDSAQSNVGRVGIVWLDECPVWATVSTATGFAGLSAPARAFAATYSEAVVPYRVESAADMGPGCWRVVSES
jgi:hypothetical protein